MYMPNNLGDLGKTSPTKAAAKLVKIAAKEAKHDAKISAKVAKYGEGSAKAGKVLAKEAKHDAKLGVKITKLQAIAAPVVTPAPTVPAIVTPPEPVSAPPSTVSTVTQVAPPAFSIAPPPASETFAPPIMQPPNMFTGAPSASPDSAAPAPAAEEPSKMPLVLGAVGVGAVLLYMATKKRK